MLWEKNSLIQAGKAEERRSPRNSHDKVIWSLTWSASTWLLVNWVSGSYLWQYLTSDPEIVSVASKDGYKKLKCVLLGLNCHRGAWVQPPLLVSLTMITFSSPSQRWKFRSSLLRFTFVNFHSEGNVDVPCGTFWCVLAQQSDSSIRFEMITNLFVQLPFYTCLCQICF